MKILSRIAVACATIAAMSMPAAAIEADFTGFFQVRAFTYDNLNGNDDVNDKARGVDQRFRLWNSTALHEDVKAVFAIEIDSAWGDGAVGAVGADAKSQIEIKNLYLDFNIPGAATNVKAGAQYFAFGNRLIQGEDASGLLVRHTPVPGKHSFMFGWVKMNEGDVFTSRDDGDYYHLQYDGNVAGWKVSPFVAYMDGRPTGRGLNMFDASLKGWYFGLETSGKAGPIGLAATAIVNFWDTDSNVFVSNADTGVDSGMGLALWAKGTYALGSTTFSAEAAFYGDDEAGAFVNIRGYNPYAEVIAGGRFENRSAMGGTSSVAGTGLGHDRYMNHLYGKLGVDHRFNDKHRVSAFYIYAQEAADTFTRDKIKFGHEIDAYYDYAISKGLTFSVGGGYLFADDEFGAGDDAYKYGTAVTYRF